MAFEGAQRSLNRYREVTWDMVNFSSDSPPETIKQDFLYAQSPGNGCGDRGITGTKFKRL